MSELFKNLKHFQSLLKVGKFTPSKTTGRYRSASGTSCQARQQPDDDRIAPTSALLRPGTPAAGSARHVRRPRWPLKVVSQLAQGGLPARRDVSSRREV